MRFSTVIGTALTASLAISAPLEPRAMQTVWVVDVVTSYTTVFPGEPTPTSPAADGGSASTPTSPAAAGGPPPTPAPAAFLQGSTQKASDSAPAPAVNLPPPPPQAVSTPAASSGSSSSSTTSGGWIQAQNCNNPSAPTDFSSSPVTCGVSWIDTINMFRKAYGKSELSWSGSLAAVAGNVDGLTNFHHNTLGDSTGSWGETMAGGSFTGTSHGATPFAAMIAGEWLCESPNDPELQASGFAGFNLCQAFSGGGSIGETAHHDIFLGDYTKIGCGYKTELVCDFA